MSPDDAKDRRKAALAAAALLLLQERRARRLLRKAIRLPLQLLGLGGSHLDVDYAIRAHGRRTLVELRSQARAASQTAWRKTTKEPALRVIRGGLDEQRAASAAANLANLWGKQFERHAAEGTSGDPAEAATVDIEYAVDRAATTETVDAFNDETEAMADAAAFDPRLVVVQTWEGILDTRTCPECEALEGVSMTRPDRFAELPPLHPLCRCFLSTWITEAAAVAA